MAPRALPASKLRARRKKRRVVLVLVALGVLLLVLLGVVGLAWLPALRITTIEVAGASSVGKEAIQEIVRADLRGTQAGVLPNDNAFLYKDKVIQKHLLDTFAVFESVTVSRKGLNTLVVTAVERTTAALWCGESLANPSPCYLLDKTGSAYAPAADFSGETYVRYYGPVSSSTPRQFVSPEQFTALSALVTALKNKGIAGTPVRVEINGAEGDITFDNNFTLMYSLADDGADVLERFVLALQAEPFTTHSVADFLYLDLRFGDKLYYRLK